ncbi:hypothetical protein Mpet_2496 [Methanolacinia petrolearia DSM 11571]|uniref:Uncharacterized protein n=1 Tax=Methanolacinia petrolearia (strain DSM 11571 / OCM 486 / SEBR 4847) TaxID=679926 RepID=E1REZ6_METP4|nr:hypothetical protein Mpet_2496 [Methanolacinia petrolearia DSM 11571]
MLVHPFLRLIAIRGRVIGRGTSSPSLTGAKNYPKTVYAAAVSFGTFETFSPMKS